jgi:hypothetical protein
MLFTDYITFPELSSPAQTLYEHMTRHIKDHGMKVVAMTPTVDADIDNVSCLTLWRSRPLMNNDEWVSDCCLMPKYWCPQYNFQNIINKSIN